MPRVIGLMKSVEMMLTSKPVGSAEALELGLVEAEVSRIQHAPTDPFACCTPQIH